MPDSYKDLFLSSTCYMRVNFNTATKFCCKKLWKLTQKRISRIMLMY